MPNSDLSMKQILGNSLKELQKYYNNDRSKAIYAVMDYMIRSGKGVTYEDVQNFFLGKTTSNWGQWVTAITQLQMAGKAKQYASS